MISSAYSISPAPVRAESFCPDVFGWGAFDPGTVRRIAYLDNPRNKPTGFSSDDACISAATLAGESASYLFPGMSPSIYAEARAELAKIAMHPEFTGVFIAKYLLAFSIRVSPETMIARLRTAERHSRVHPLLAAAALCGNLYQPSALNVPEDDIEGLLDPELPMCTLLAWLLLLRRGYFYLARVVPETVMADYPEACARALRRSRAQGRPGIWIGYFLRCLERSVRGVTGEMEPLPELLLAPSSDDIDDMEIEEEEREEVVGMEDVIDPPQGREITIENGVAELLEEPQKKEISAKKNDGSEELTSSSSINKEGTEHSIFINGKQSISGLFYSFSISGEYMGPEERRNYVTFLSSDPKISACANDTGIVKEVAKCSPETMVSDLSERIMEVFKQEEEGACVGISKIVEITQGNRNTIKTRLRELISAGRLVRHGKGRNSGYVMVKEKA